MVEKTIDRQKIERQKHEGRISFENKGLHVNKKNLRSKDKDVRRAPSRIENVHGQYSHKVPQSNF